ncbi:MAG: universal stress protein [Phaeodactylibacter sp.]|nr:universal stress protein [Phaeodactylibacter sp.]MCB9301080.1 universal stress protein [Lewinellaceae bacterium]
MKTILVPTDFSDTSQNAFRYAAKLAEVMNADSIQVAHVFLPETTGEADFIPPVVEIMESRKEMLKSFVSELLDENQPLPCPVGQELLVGFPADELSIASKDYSYLVMGATGQSGILDKVLGSVSSSVSQRAACPVLLIPDQTSFTPYRHIIYASNYDSINEAMLEKLIRFNRHFKAHLHFVHIRAEKGQPLGDALEAIFRQLFDNGEPDFAFDVVELEDENVAEGLNHYAEKVGAGLVVMVTRHRSFWQSILHHSETKRMALSPRFPLMVMHLGA